MTWHTDTQLVSRVALLRTVSARTWQCFPAGSSASVGKSRAGLTWGGPCWRRHLLSSRFPGGALNVLLCGENNTKKSSSSISHNVLTCTISSRFFPFVFSAAHLVLFTLHGQVFFDEDTICRWREQKGSLKHTVTHRQVAGAQRWERRKRWVPDCALWKKKKKKKIGALLWGCKQKTLMCDFQNKVSERNIFF